MTNNLLTEIEKGSTEIRLMTNGLSKEVENGNKETSLKTNSLFDRNCKGKHRDQIDDQ